MVAVFRYIFCPSGGPPFPAPARCLPLSLPWFLPTSPGRRRGWRKTCASPTYLSSSLFALPSSTKSCNALQPLFCLCLHSYELRIRYGFYQQWSILSTRYFPTRSQPWWDDGQTEAAAAVHSLPPPSLLTPLTALAAFQLLLLLFLWLQVCISGKQSPF